MAESDDHLLPTTRVRPDPELTGSFGDDGEVTPPTPAGRPRPTLGAYELLDEVRSWPGGALYEAWHPRLRRTVLLRVLRKEAADPDARAAFARSAQALAQLNHPNVAGAVLEVCPDGPVPYLVLETGFGAPLAGLGPRDRLARQCEILYPNRRLAQAMLDAARGLAAVHRVGLRHGALRPDAVRVHTDDTILLAGLGEGESTDLDAPDGSDGRAADLFALGAAFYQLVTGQAPAGPDPPPAKSLNPGVSRDVSDILADCLTADPRNRFDTADALAADLAWALRVEVVPAPWGRRMNWVFEVLAAFVVGVVLVFAAVVVAAVLRAPLPKVLDSTDVLTVLALPPFLYWALSEVLFGRTPLRRWQRFEVADASGDPAPRRWRVARSALKVGLVGGWLVGVGPALVAAVEIGGLAFAPMLLLWALPAVAPMLFVSTFLVTYRFFRGDRLTIDDNQQMVRVLPHDLLTGTRVVVRRPAAPRALPPAAPSAADALGGPAIDRVGPYDLGPRLGAGGMGSVHRAWDRALRRPAAVKFLGDHLVHDDRARERFEREGRLAAQLSHPNVARVYGVGEADGRPYIAQELIDGETLRQRVARLGPLPVTEAWGYCVQAAEALRAADRLGIVHRDVKPDNMMVTPQGTLKVTDFGLSRQVEGEVPVTGAGGAVGTPQYMAPEQARGQPVDRRADMYSLGLTLHYLISGRPAFAANNPMDRLALQLAGPPPSLVGQVPGLTDAQGAVLDRLLAPRREDRFADYDALVETLRTESPDRAPAAPRVARHENAVIHLCCCGLLFGALYALARWVLPAVLPAGAAAELAAVTPLSPGLLLVWQCAVTLLTVWVFVYRPSLHPASLRGRGTRSAGEVGRIVVASVYWLAMACLLFWPTTHRSIGLRVTERTGRRLRPGRALLRFAATYPLLLPWAWLALLPGLSVEAIGLPLVCANLGLLAVSAVVARRRADGRNLADLVAGTRVVRVPPPALRLMPEWDRMPRADRLVRMGLSLALTWSFPLVLFGGCWVGCWFWLEAERAEYPARRVEREQKAREKKEARFEEAMRRYKQTAAEYKQRELARGCSPTGVQLAILGGAYRTHAMWRDRSPHGPDDLRTALEPDDLRCPETGEEYVVLWGTSLTASRDDPEDDIDVLLAYQRSANRDGRRHVATGDGGARAVSPREFERLLAAQQK